MRFVVEHAFGRLKGRWRCLLKRNDTSLKYIIRQIAACCVLHNICEMQDEEFMAEWNIEDNNNEGNEEMGNEDDEQAENIRDVLKDLLARQQRF